MSEKQTTFFTINCAEKLKSPNQCQRVRNIPSSCCSLLCYVVWRNRVKSRTESMSHRGQKTEQEQEHLFLTVKVNGQTRSLSDWAEFFLRLSQMKHSHLMKVSTWQCLMGRTGPQFSTIVFLLFLYLLVPADYCTDIYLTPFILSLPV
jgi:hypothetical protein